MTTRGLLRALPACLALCACSGPEVRVGANEGIPAIKGSSTFSLNNFTCGQTITSNGYTVTSMAVGSDCQLNFDNDVQVLKASDYQNIPQLSGASKLVQAVELQVNQLAFADASNGQALDLNTYVKSATLSVNGQQVADKSVLAHLPATVDLSGAALAQVKTAVDARQPCTVHVTAVMVIPQTPAPPQQLKVDYDAQPTLVLGTGSIQLPTGG